MSKGKEKYEKALREMRGDSANIPKVMKSLNAFIKEGSARSVC